jgi:hypothetical protein
LLLAEVFASSLRSTRLHWLRGKLCGCVPALKRMKNVCVLKKLKMDGAELLSYIGPEAGSEPRHREDTCTPPQNLDVRSGERIGLTCGVETADGRHRPEAERN